MTTMHIVEAKKGDAKILTELTIRSKDYWNYGRDQIEAWRDELTIDQACLDSHAIFKGIIADGIVGYYAFQVESLTRVKLTHLFVDPPFIGKDYGKHLLSDAIERVRAQGCKQMTLDADPNAESFYARFGFTQVGQLQSSIKDRFLPIMELIL